MQNTGRGQSTALDPDMSLDKNKDAKVVDIIDLTYIEEEMDESATPGCSVKLSCVVCKETFTDSIELHKHATLAHSDLKIFFCDLCTKSFLCEKDMQEHKQAIHHIALENNDYLLIQKKDVKNQNVSKHTGINKNLNINRKRGRPRKALVKSYVAVNKIEIKTRSKRKSCNNLKHILAKHGCLKKVTIPLVRIDNHPLIQQKMSNKKENNSSQIIVKKTYKMDEEENVFLVKVKKCRNKGDVFTISRVDEKVNVKDISDESHGGINTSVLKELISKLDEQNSTNTVVKTDGNENGITSDIKATCSSTTNDKQKKLKGFHKTDKEFSKIRLQNVRKNINILRKVTAKEKGNDSEMVQSQSDEKQIANTSNNVKPLEGNVGHEQHKTDAAQDCSTAKQKSNNKKSFITSIEVFEPNKTLINTQDTTRQTLKAPQYLPVLHPIDKNPNITNKKQYNPQVLGNTTLLPLNVTSEQSLMRNEPITIKNIIFLKKQDGIITNIEGPNKMKTLNLLKQIASQTVPPVLKEIAIQTNPEDDKMYALVMDYLMCAMKLLNPIIMTNGRSVSLSEYRKKRNIAAFVELDKKPSESQIVSHIRGMCCSCRSVASLVKQVTFSKQSVGKSKCPLCNERYASVIGVKQHLKRAHLPCSIMTGKKHLKVKIIDTVETLYVPKSSNLFSECFCCKTKFSDIKEFIKHIELFHYQSITNIIQQSDNELSVYEEDYFITIDQHFENMKYQAIDKVASVNSERSVEATNNSNVNEKDDHSFCAGNVSDTTENVTLAAQKTAKTSGVKRSRSVEGPSSIQKDIRTKSKNPTSYLESTEQLKIQNKKLKHLDETKKSKHPYLCLKCFNAFESNSDLLKHVETHLVDSPGKSDVNMHKHLSSTTGKQNTPTPSENTDKSEQNISPTIEEGSKLTEADSTVLINSTRACPSNFGNNEENTKSTAIEPVSQNRDETKSSINVQSGVKVDQNYCSSTSNANIDLISDQSVDSIDSLATVNSAQTIVISGSTCTNCNKTFDGQKSLHDHMYFLHDIAIEESVMADILEPNTSETQEKPTKEDKGENNNEATNQENDNTTESEMPVIRRVWPCFQCGECFNIKEDLLIHGYNKHNDESLVHVCENCQAVLMSYSAVNMHLCSNVQSWRCRRCKLNFSNGQSLRSHNIQKHLEREGKKKCPLCNKKFLTMSMLDRHISFIHKGNEGNDTKKLSVKKDSMSASEPNNTVSSSIQCSMPDNPSPSTSHGGSQNNDAKTSQNNTNHCTVTNPVLFDAKKAVAWQYVDADSAYRLFDGDVYTCGVCHRETNSKPGLKLHLKKQHRISAEECQLCTQLFEKDSIGKHLIRDHVIPKYSKEENLEGHDFNGESFLKLLSPERLLMCCQYQKYVDKTFHGVETMTCPKCAKNFLNGRFHRIHFLWMHDRTCLLCNVDFDKPSTAVGHKIRVHNSIGTYMWAVEKILRTLLDLNIFGETLEDMINKLENEQTFVGKGHSNRKTKSAIGKDSPAPNTAQGSTTTMQEENSSVLSPTTKNDTDQVFEEIAAQKSAADDSEEDDKRLVLVITQSDIERHKNDIKTLAKNLCADSKVFSQDYIEKLLESYIQSKKI